LPGYIQEQIFCCSCIQFLNNIIDVDVYSTRSFHNQMCKKHVGGVYVENALKLEAKIPSLDA
jgi:hypothetical protein